jgi:hypothetical protein
MLVVKGETMNYKIHFKGFLGTWTHLVKTAFPVEYIEDYLRNLGDPAADMVDCVHQLGKIAFKGVATPKQGLNHVWANLALAGNVAPSRAVKPMVRPQPQPRLEKVWASLI